MRKFLVNVNGTSYEILVEELSGAAAVPARPGRRPAAARLQHRAVRRHAPFARTAVATGRAAPLLLDAHPVLARLPVRLRVLQHHRHAGPQAADQVG